MAGIDNFTPKARNVLSLAQKQAERLRKPQISTEHLLFALIEMEGCIRCGVCHDVCPQDAIRHDSEKTGERVDGNVETTKKFMDLCAKHLGDEKERAKCLNRMIKYFNNQKVIAEKTLEVLGELKKTIQ